MICPKQNEVLIKKELIGIKNNVEDVVKKYSFLSEYWVYVRTYNFNEEFRNFRGIFNIRAGTTKVFEKLFFKIHVAKQIVHT